LTFLASNYKIPVSVLVVVYTPELDVLLLERADRPGFWQSVTGSQDEGETLRETAVRELREETGIDAARCELTDWRRQNRYEIYRRWRSRYAPDVTHNTEHVFGLKVPQRHEIPRQPLVAGRGGERLLVEQRRGHTRAAEARPAARRETLTRIRTLRKLPHQ